ncbi:MULTISPECIES: hypothetical protein [unclassified Halomonas]|nr:MULTISPECIES: hypothetical protein [unclassified Halomonas]MDT0500678.1 hypothetical protein [Halomonas sp. PAR7]MDT0513131.1 hypothetical protein [Halomonas sp. LES1]MDT0591458.1 hypothetical protein [Halomonas sp. PAR8]
MLRYRPARLATALACVSLGLLGLASASPLAASPDLDDWQAVRE